MKEYKKRIADVLLKNKLEGMGAVLIEGPKWCGKTTTAEQQAKSKVYMDDASEGTNWVQLANVNPKGVLVGEVPRLIDEWQIAPQLWDAIRYQVDHRGEDGQFILTGSSFLMVLTAVGKFAYQREDGIYVVPIGCLKD